MNTSSLNINVLNYLLEKLEHRTRSILKKKAKYTEQPSIPTNEFLLFITEVQDDLKQSIAVIKKLLQDNKQMETIYLNQTLSNSQGDVNKVISDLKQDNNCLIAEIENLKLQLMYNNTNNSNHIDYNKEYHSYSRKEDVKNMKDVISDMKRNKLQIKQEIKKHFSNNNSNNNSNVIIQRDGVITEYNDEEDSKGDNVKYKCKCYKKHLNSKSKSKSNNNNNNNKRRNKPYFVNYTSPYGKLFTDILKERDNMN